MNKDEQTRLIKELRALSYTEVEIAFMVGPIESDNEDDTN